MGFLWLPTAPSTATPLLWSRRSCHYEVERCCKIGSGFRHLKSRQLSGRSNAPRSFWDTSGRYSFGCPKVFASLYFSEQDNEEGAVPCSEAQRRFYEEISKPEDEINLIHASLYIAQDDLRLSDEDVVETSEEISRIVANFEKRKPTVDYPMRIIKAVNKYLYAELGFDGASEWRDSRNVYLPYVVRRRLGYSVSLGLIYREICNTHGFPVEFVGMPGHFMLRALGRGEPADSEMDLYIDPYRQGEVLLRLEMEHRLGSMLQSSKRVELEPKFAEAETKRRTLYRMLRSLKRIYLHRAQLESALSVVDKLNLLDPTNPFEKRDRGILLYYFGKFESARHDLEMYWALKTSAPDNLLLRELFREIKRVGVQGGRHRSHARTLSQTLLGLLKHEDEPQQL